MNFINVIVRDELREMSLFCDIKLPSWGAGAAKFFAYASSNLRVSKVPLRHPERSEGSTTMTAGGLG